MSLQLPAIRIEGLGKRYQLGQEHSGGPGPWFARIRDRLRSGKSAAAASSEFWALRDISFELAEGEALGIVGGNGAGKSTLLKVLSRITVPTRGRAVVRGRLASLLEVGTGFHPELTGRENVFLNGTILGMRKAEVARKFDEIVAFAGVEQFIDTPVKRYSSGMYVRLAFAVAAHLEPDVLIVDEVLAVGDIEFQERCLGKMGEVSKAGRTVLFVSHNMASLQKLCSRAIWLDKGRVAADGPPEEIVGAYVRSYLKSNSASGEVVGELYSAPEGPDGGVERVLRVQLLDQLGQPTDNCATWDDVGLRVTFRVAQRYPSFSVALSIATEDGRRLILTSTTPDQCLPFSVEPGVYEVDCRFGRLPLAAGHYLIGLNLAVPRVGSVWKNDAMCELRVLERDVFGAGMAPTSTRYVVVADSSWNLPVRKE
jgi:lipopolysaccharide transport system ATP-binding protein